MKNEILAFTEKWGDYKTFCKLNKTKHKKVGTTCSLSYMKAERNWPKCRIVASTDWERCVGEVEKLGLDFILFLYDKCMCGNKHWASDLNMSWWVSNYITNRNRLSQKLPILSPGIKPLFCITSQICFVFVPWYVWETVYNGMKKIANWNERNRCLNLASFWAKEMMEVDQRISLWNLLLTSVNGVYGNIFYIHTYMVYWLKPITHFPPKK